MEYMYYGRMIPVSASTLKKNGVWHFMQKEFVLFNIEKLEKKLTEEFHESLKHLRKDMLNNNKSLKADIEILLEDKEKRDLKEKEQTEVAQVVIISTQQQIDPMPVELKELPKKEIKPKKKTDKKNISKSIRKKYTKK